MNQKIQFSKEYGLLLEDIKMRVKSAQYRALKAVNRELVGLYWDVGKIIVKRQERERWGKAVVKQLSGDLRKAFPGTRGFSTQNLWFMRQFYLSYQANEKLQPMVREIPWSHNFVVMTKCKDVLEREFYIRMTRRHGWTKRVLIHQIENKSYEKTLLGQSNFDKVLSTKRAPQAKLALKDEYLFDFLELGTEHSERELQDALLKHVERFIKEMGGLFSFLGSRYRLEVSGKEFFIDLLLFHRKLKCLVAVELKIGEFLPEYVGKMQFYLAALDDLVRLDGEKPSVGIILCKERDRTIVEYTLRDSGKPIGVASYKVMSRLPEELIGELPSPEQIGRLLGGI